MAVCGNCFVSFGCLNFAHKCYFLQAEGVRTEAGTWCVDEEERDHVQQTLDRAEGWDALLESKSEWLRPPQALGEEDYDEDKELAESFLKLLKARNAEEAAEEAEAAAEAELKENLDSVEKGLEGEIKVRNST